MLAEKQSLQRWAIVQLSLLWSSCWISPLINAAVCAGEVKGFRSASFSVTHRPFLFWGGAVLLKGCDVHVRQAESLWNFTRHFTSGADCTWVLQSPVTEEGEPSRGWLRARPYCKHLPLAAVHSRQWESRGTRQATLSDFLGTKMWVVWMLEL